MERREIHRYEVPPTYAIWICDFPISEQKLFRGDWAIRNKDGLTLSEKMMYIDVYDIVVNRASEKLIKDQANDMVWTEEELDRWALLEVRAEQKAIAKGHKQGLEQGRVEMALDMLSNNEPIEKIVKYSHLPESKILELKASLAGDAIK